MVVAAEGALPLGGAESLKAAGVDDFGHVRLGGIGGWLAEEIERRTGHETRSVVLGHLQRGGTPTAYDRVLSTRFGLHAVEAVHDKDFGVMVALRGVDIVRVPLGEATARLKTVPAERLPRRASSSADRAAPARPRTRPAAARVGMRTRPGRCTRRNYAVRCEYRRFPDVLAGLDAWRDLPAAQQPSWPDAGALDDAVRTLSTYPPLVFAGECDILRDRLAEAAPRRGLRAPGRRLRRDVRVRDRRQHPRPGQDHPADGGGADLRRAARRSSRSAGWPASTPSRAAATTRPATASRCRPTAATWSTTSPSRRSRARPTRSAWSAPTTPARRP